MAFLAAATADELGRLVHDFNRMAADLARQRRELERTQRLEAWAQMARQVARVDEARFETGLTGEVGDPGQGAFGGVERHEFAASADQRFPDGMGPVERHQIG